MQTKLWRLVHNILVVWLVLCPYEVLASFGTDIYCYIRGYVYYDGHEVDVDRQDGCHMVSGHREGRQLVLSTEIHWVIIEIPKDIRGNTPFWYKWGSDHAYIDGKSYKVEWGYLLRG